MTDSIPQPAPEKPVASDELVRLARAGERMTSFGLLTILNRLDAAERELAEARQAVARMETIFELVKTSIEQLRKNCAGFAYSNLTEILGYLHKDSSSSLASHDAEQQAKALEEAADENLAGRGLNHDTRQLVHDWLVARAASLLRGAERKEQ